MSFFRVRRGCFRRFRTAKRRHAAHPDGCPAARRQLLAVSPNTAAEQTHQRREPRETARPHTTHGLQQLERLWLRRERQAHQGDSGFFRLVGLEGCRLPVRQHRRLLVTEGARCRRQTGAGSREVSFRDPRAGRVRARPRAQAGDLRRRRHEDLRGLPG